MSRRIPLALSISALIVAATAAAAQSTPPTYKADPDTYKLIFENEAFRVISATWKKGATDKPHSHPVPSIVYALDDCVLKLHNPDGTTREIKNKAGAVTPAPIVVSHTAENSGASDCHAIIVERK